MRKMKDSGIEWIGDIPEGWEVGRLKNIFTLYPFVNTGLIDSKSDVTFLPMENIKRGFYINGERKFSEYVSSYNIFENGDILLAKVTPCFENGNIALVNNLTNGIGFGTSEIFVIRSLEANVKFIFYYLQGEHFRQRAIATMTGVGGLKRVSPTFMKNEVAIIPPLSEQQRIADYLDARCARIDEAAELVRQSMEKLRAYKLSLITETVTKGLDPDVPMKDSGIPWIGEIPEGWTVAPLKKQLESIVDYRGKTPEKTESGIFLVTAKNIKNGKIDYALSQEYVSEEDYSLIMRRGLPEKGDILFTTEAPLGEVALVDQEKIALAQRIIKFRVCKNILSNVYLKYWINSSGFQFFLKTLSTGSTAEGIKASKIFMLPVLLPPLSEQQRIADYLDAKCARIDALLEEKEKLLDRLAEYKKSLIFECVTGKREVSA